MYHEFFAGRAILTWPIVAMVLFAATFAAVLVRVVLLQKHRGRDYDQLSQLPLCDGAKLSLSTQGGDHE